MAKSEENSSDVRSARVKLDGLLKDLIKKTEESEDEASSTAGSSVSFQMPPPSTPTKRYGIA
ncbi:cell cycle [Desmophyllum pertusum]|uniref:Cell cycle n=1 Tax=Desmophyllum pertusum TaxID=174260 RepID=A0A9W9YQQ1_9CNID|nr:cell cycle [Desmophyllum pertusum]